MCLPITIALPQDSEGFQTRRRGSIKALSPGVQLDRMAPRLTISLGKRPNLEEVAWSLDTQELFLAEDTKPRPDNLRRLMMPVGP